jgi:hypothetical protein
MNAVNSGGLRGIYSQVNITNFCYGQSLVYEAEGGNWGFSYGTRRGKIEQEQGRTVLHACTTDCGEWDATPRYILENITENLQHTDRNSGKPNDLGNWKIRPMMKIDSMVVDNHPDWPVVKVNIINFQGDTIKSVIIKARNFAFFDVGSGTYIYNGSYIDIFDFTLDPGTDLNVSGSTNGGLNEGWDSYPWPPEWDANCHVDFKVWWYGQTDVWIDYVTVNDELGEELFGGSYDAFILHETSPVNLIKLSSMVMKNEFSEANYKCINYIMNIMYQKLHNQAQPITLK